MSPVPDVCVVGEGASQTNPLIPPEPPMSPDPDVCVVGEAASQTNPLIPPKPPMSPDRDVCVVLQCDQPRSRPEARRTDTPLITPTNRKHRSHLLHVLHHLWHSRCSGETPLIALFTNCFIVRFVLHCTSSYVLR